MTLKTNKMYKVNWIDARHTVPPSYKLIWVVNDGKVMLGWSNEGIFYEEGNNRVLKAVLYWANVEIPLSPFVAA